MTTTLPPKALLAAALAPLLSLAPPAAAAGPPSPEPPQPAEPAEPADAPPGAEEVAPLPDTLDVQTGQILADSTAAALLTAEPRADEWTPSAHDDGEGPLLPGLAGLPGSTGLDAPAQQEPTSSSIVHVRGGSLIPPMNGQTVYWDAPGSGYEVRRLRGVEPLDDPANFYVRHADVYKRTGWNSTYGRQLLMRNGGIFEGCALQASGTAYLCDFKVDGQPKRLQPGKSSAYWRRVLVDWGRYQSSYLLNCGGSVVGLWTGHVDLNDMAVSCIDYGPYTVQ